MFVWAMLLGDGAEQQLGRRHTLVQRYVEHILFLYVAVKGYANQLYVRIYAHSLKIYVMWQTKWVNK